MLKVYTTKCALTTGIESHMVRCVLGSEGKFVYVDEKDSFSREQFVMGETAFLTYSSAAKAAREMRNKRRVSLHRQLNKLNGTIFETREPDHLRN